MWRLFLTLFARGYSDNFSCASTGGLGLLQKSPSVQRLTVEVESIDREWVAVDGGADRACRGKSAGDNLASYFTVNSGLASLSACQALCEGTANCQGVEFHTSGRCEVWTRPGGIEASISLSGYSCYAYALSDFIPADDGSNRACRGDTANDDQASYYQVTSVSSLGECKELCRSNVACRGVEFSGSRCEVWTRAIRATAALAGAQCLKLEFALIDGPDRACRGSGASDNNPAHYTVAEGSLSEAECKQACRLHSGCQGIEHSGSRCEIWTRPEGIQATVTLTGFKCYAYQGSGVSTTTTPAPEGSAAEKARFLIQATFGPTMASLAAMEQMNFQQWIDDQMGLPLQSHREFWRQRANPHLSATDEQGDLVGLTRSRCEPGSRWVGYTFQKRDEGKAVKVSNNQIFVDGLRRTDIDPNYAGNGLDAPKVCSNDPPEYWQTRGMTCETFDPDSMSWNCYSDGWTDSCRQTCFDLGHSPGDDCSTGWVGRTFDGFLCSVKSDAVGAWVLLATSEDCTEGRRPLTNPHIWRANPSAEMTQSLSFSVFKKSVLHLTAAPAQCNLGTVARSTAEGVPRFYLLDPRLQLVKNTLQEPASSSSWGGGICPAVSKTFLNEGSCKLLPGCLPVGMASVQVPLTAATFATFFSVGGRYVYAIKGLRTSTNPCNRRSRWRKLDCASESCSATSLLANDLAAIQAELTAASAQGWLRDVDVECGEVAAGVVVEVGSEHFQHVHLDEFNVYDFTDWTHQHPGGTDPITRWTGQGYELEFPSWHGMERWNEGIAPGVLRPNLVGKYKESIEFQSLPQPLQTQDLREALATGQADGKEYSIVCGSPGEVANNAFLGHQLPARHRGEYDWHFDMDYFSRWGSAELAKTAVWTMQALYAEDQLRQRTAWALSQIFVLAVVGGSFEGRTEMWLNYYDIFIRNAFGTYRDILREVTYNPIMGDYLTFKRNRAFDESNNYPDENFAREIMQLFSIGLWKLNPDGTRKKDASGLDIPTYTNEHIMNFARVFTGFDEQADRDNVEYVQNHNFIDPMRVNARWHDVYPKPDLDGNFLGDGYPLCSDLPPGYFLLQGAKFEFLGHNYGGSDVLSLDSSSQLFAKLCGSGTSPCRHSLIVELDQTLTCSNQECAVDTISVVNVSGGYYKYLPPSCVNLFFFNGQVTRRGGRAWGWTDRCENPQLAVAGTACCGGCKNRKDWYWLDRRGCSCDNATTVCPELFTERCNHHETWREHQWCRLACWENGVGYEGDNCTKGLWRGERACGHDGELVRMASAQKTCASRGLEICGERLEGYGCGYDEVHVWTPEKCSYEVLVHADGKVSSNLTSRTRQNKFYVPWKNGDHPQSPCPAGCRSFTDGCSCGFTVETRRAFDAAPDAAAARSRLRIGAAKPQAPCTQNCQGAVKVYGAMDEEAIFEVGGRFYKNKEVVVVVGSFEFRNPPSFVSLENPQERDIHVEVESLLDHLVFHENTAPFISYRLIQRLTSSNPTPAYVGAVAEAFRTGTYAGRTYQGVYGDLAATVAAILLHPEARSQTAETHGALREPLVKVVHFMRSMEYKDSAGRNVMLSNLMPVIGQFPYLSPSVFNFYLPDFKPSDFPEGKVGPEFEIFTPPLAIGFMNGLTSLIEHGLGPAHCETGGMGFAAPSNCSVGELHLGELECLQPTIDQMDLLLTGGRLHDSGKIKAAWQNSDGGHEYKTAQMAMVLMPEFHTLGSPLALGQRAPPPPVVLEEPRSYKALVMIFMNGGADTFNMLVPMNCPLYDEYSEVRGSVALDPTDLNMISTTGQSCGNFGIHARLPILKELYDLEQVAFLSDIGSLAEPISKDQWESGTGERCTGLFSHSDQQQAAQTLTCQNSGSAQKGAGGRVADALASGSQKFRTMSFSVAGMSTWSQGKQTSAEIIDQHSGTVSFKHYDRLKTVIDNITSVRHGNIYAEEYSTQFAKAIKFNQELGNQLETAKLKTSFPTNEIDLSRQLKQVARLISARHGRKSERDVFYVEIGGWDTHSSVSQELNNRFQELNSALTSFVNEMKAQNIFDSTTVVTHSDFARTLTPNSGEGTDHGWSGNYMVLGGAVKGGRVYNDFPSSFKEGGTQDAGRGRLIPKYPWENMMLPVAQWMGLESGQINTVFPNVGAFNSSLLLSSSTLFK
ncbi:unnamed protein product [Durusdinium trenchii]|uniref:Apple domain-containing protein n=1 Tax=Durusdinium trenchii TaxID=1381693 RepID=A0ABP0JX83_9DINO